MLTQDGVVHNPGFVSVNRRRLAQHGIVGLYLATPLTVTGTTWKDLSLNRSNGTLQAGLAISADRRTNGMRGTNRTGGIGEFVLDGTAGYVTLGQPASLNFVGQTNAFSILVCFRRLSTPGANSWLVAKGNHNTGQYQWGFYIATSNGALGFYNSVAISLGTTNVCDGKWHAGVLSVPAASTGLLIFLDGAQESFSSGSGAIAATASQPYDVLFGALRNGNNSSSFEYFGGSMDCIMLFNRALNAAEAAYWTNAAKTGLRALVSYSRGWQTPIGGAAQIWPYLDNELSGGFCPMGMGST